MTQARYVTELFRAHHLELVRLAVLIVGDLATAEDVVQDAFEQLHRRWRTLRKQSSALDYARSAVLNGSRSVLRRRSVARRHAARISAHQRRRRPLDRLPWTRCAGPDPPVPFLEGGVRHA